VTRSRGRWGALLAVLALALLAPDVQAGGGPVTTAPLAAGVVHEVWPVDGSGARIHLARIAAGPSTRLAVVQARGGLVGGRETPSSMCRRTRGCRVALNGDFYTADGPVGGVVAGGRMLRSPRPDHEQLSLEPLRVTTDGWGQDGWFGQVQPSSGEPMDMDGVNVALGPDQLVLYTSAYGAPTPVCSCAELVLAEGEQRADQLGGLAGLTIIGRGSGSTPLPPGTAVLAGEGAAGARLTALADASHGSDGARRLAVSLTVTEPTRHNLGAHPVLLRDGQPAPVDAADPMLGERHPRSVVAWDASGTVWLAAAEGRQPRGPGLTATEVVTFLQRIGATHAVLLDGGGSTSLATPDGPLSSPSEGRERPVSNAVVVVVEPSSAGLRTPAAPAAAPTVAATPAPVPVAPPAPQAPAAAAPERPLAELTAPASQVASGPVAVAEPPPPRVFSRMGAERATGSAGPAPPLAVASPPQAHPPAPAVATAVLLLAAAAWPHGARAGPRPTRTSTAD
jgi:hypothetical protein